MRQIRLHICILFSFVAIGLQAQNSLDSTAQNELSFNAFDPEDSLGIALFNLLDQFETFGHFGPIESKQKDAQFIEKYIALFEPSATLPDDLTDTIIGNEVSLSAYKKLAQNKGYFAYSLFLEKDSSVAYKLDTSDYYYLTLRVFKLFDDKAIIGNKYKHGAIYAIGVKLKENGLDAKITDVNLLDGEEHFKFKLGNYGRHIYSTLLVSNNVNSLVQEIPPPYVPTFQPTKSNFFLHVGYQLTSFLEPEAFRNNLNPDATFSGEEWGRSAGIKYQKAFANKDVFGIFAGVEFEQNFYDFDHANSQFIYAEDENGDPLVDLEGGSYDKKHVDLHSYEESGSFNYVKPEIGVFLNLGGKVLNFQLLGSIGNAFLVSSEYEATANVSYKGEIEGIGSPISEDALGFYTDLQQPFSGSHSEMQSFMFYKGGAGLDIIMGQRVSLSLLVEYKGSFTYVARKNSTGLAFLNPDTGEGFTSQFNSLSESRNYSGIALQAGIKIYLNELR